jgi:hypothetical protein
MHAAVHWGGLNAAVRNHERSLQLTARATPSRRSHAGSLLGLLSTVGAEQQREFEHCAAFDKFNLPPQHRSSPQARRG